VPGRCGRTAHDPRECGQLTPIAAYRPARRDPIGTRHRRETPAFGTTNSRRESFIRKEVRAICRAVSAESTPMMPTGRRRSSTSRVLAASGYIAKIWRWTAVRQVPGPRENLAQGRRDRARRTRCAQARRTSGMR
jgi:hypothetical protein